MPVMSGRKQLTLHSYFHKNKQSTAAYSEDENFGKKLNWLYEAINHIKQQKQRPDRERICHYVQLHHSISTDEVTILLDHCVKSGLMSTGTTRGNTEKLTYTVVDGVNNKDDSAGNADMSAPETFAEKRIIHNKSDITQLMVDAVKGLRQSAGSNLNDIAEYILTSCNVDLKNGVDLIQLVQINARQAVRNGLLVKVKNLYKIPRGPGRPALSGSLKPKVKVKPMPICSFCLGDEKKNRDGNPEDLISCSNCGQSGHPSCLKFSEKLTQSVKSRNDWQCLDCKTCNECSITKRSDNNMLICDQCDRSFHLPCCKPPLKKPPDGTWICHLCGNGSQNKKSSADALLINTESKKPSALIKDNGKRMCPTPGCDGSGNVNARLSHHRRQTSCPLISRKERFRLKHEKESTLTNDQAKTRRFGLQTSLSEPKGLVDGLTRFFTPSDKRKSRVSMNSVTPTTTTTAVKQSKPPTTTLQAAANRLVKRSRQVQRDKAKALHAANGKEVSDPCTIISQAANDRVPGVSQLKGLVDGMTKFFTPTGERKKYIPNYAPPIRKRTKTSSKDTTQEVTSANESDDGGMLSDGYKSDPSNPIIDSIDKEHLPQGVTEKDYQHFRKAQQEAKETLPVVRTSIDPGKRYPPLIEFGKYEIETWYSSPYPQEYAQLPKLYICEFCLKYMKSKSILVRHMNKCGLTHPPANEIYRNDVVSVFEVDGNSNKIYCQNLCLLAKLFLDHKTLYYDVEPFLFYVLTTNDSDGCHFVGYFSKEKHCQQKYNVSCITTLPQHQKKGYGKFLIDFSYLLSRIEGSAGSPEKPLSELGKLSYQSYWRGTILEYLNRHKEDTSLTIKNISSHTGICPHDIAATLQELNMLSVNSVDETVLSLDLSVIDDHMRRLNALGGQRLTIDEECLRWAPVVSSHLLSTPEKSSSSPEKQKAKIRDQQQTGSKGLNPVKSPPVKRSRASKSEEALLNNPKPHTKSTAAKSVTNQRAVQQESSSSHADKNSRSSTRSTHAQSNGVSAQRKAVNDCRSSDEESVSQKVQKPPPPKRKRGNCKEDKLSRNKSGSPSTPDKKTRWSSSSLNNLRSSKSTRQTSCSNYKSYGKATASDEKRGANGKASDGCEVTSSMDSSTECDYDASASDTDSGNSDEEQYSNQSDVWSPTIRVINSDSGNTTMNEDNCFNTVKESAPVTSMGGCFDKKKNFTNCLSEDMVENFEAAPDDKISGVMARISSSKETPDYHSGDVNKLIEDSANIDTLSAPPMNSSNNVPEIDPTTLCFESPISLSSNDAALSGILGDQSHKSACQTSDINSSSVLSCGSMRPHNTNHSIDGRASYEQSTNIVPSGNTFDHNNRTCVVSNFLGGQSESITNAETHNINRSAQQPQLFYPMGSNGIHNNAPQSSCMDYNQISVHQSQLHSKRQPHIQINQLAMPPPQIAIQTSPQYPGSPHVNPTSPHIMPQSPHFQHNSSMLSPNQQQYSYRSRAGSISTQVAPPSDLTPPPGSPSPTKLTPPERYQYYNNQPIKSPNITISGRSMYTPGLIPQANPSMIGVPVPTYPQQPFTSHHLFANHYFDSRYFNPHYQMPVTPQANQPTVYGHVPPAIYRNTYN